MKTFSLGATAFLIAFVTLGAIAHAEDKKAHEVKPVTLKGELVDTGCYLGHEAKGEGHKACATTCIAGGMPMGLLTADGTLYLLTLSHDNADPYKAAKEMAAKMVEITGPVMERGGLKAIEVTAIAEAKPAAK